MGIRFPCAAGARNVIGGSAPPDDGHHIFKECHSEERSDVGIRFPIWECGVRILRMSLLRCPKFSRCLTAAA